MDVLFAMIWLISNICMIIGAYKFIKNKIVKEDTDFAKGLFKISLIISIISFIAVGIVAKPIEDTNNTLSTSKNIINESNIVEDNTIANEVNNNTIANEVISNTVLNSITNSVVVENTVNEKVENDNLSQQRSNSLSNIPQYSGKPYVEINGNKPFFANTDLVTSSYETYSNLDSLGRCGVAVASIGKDIMPTEERGNIGSVKPTGWHTVKYQGIDGNYLYNRCHLIGYQLTGENANVKNLITGTRYMNNEGMLPFENMVDDYIEEYNNHVLYRVTPVFEGNNLLASGVLIEAKSVEDNGAGIEFCVYCYNVQPGITINYATGESTGPEFTGSQSTSSTTTTAVPPATSSTTTSSSSSTSSTSQSTTTKKTDSTTTTKPATTTTTAPVSNSSMVWVPKSGKKYHSNPNCSNMKNPSQVTQAEAVGMGKTPCSKCY